MSKEWQTFKVILMDKKGRKFEKARFFFEKAYCFYELYDVLRLYSAYLAGGVYKDIDSVVITKSEDI